MDATSLLRHSSSTQHVFNGWLVAAGGRIWYPDPQGLTGGLTTWQQPVTNSTAGAAAAAIQEAETAAAIAKVILQPPIIFCIFLTATPFF